MSEAKLEDSVSLLWECVGTAGLDAAKGVAAGFFEAHGGDVSKWAPETYNEFLSQLIWWSIQRSHEATDDRIRQLMGEIDEIPF